MPSSLLPRGGASESLDDSHLLGEELVFAGPRCRLEEPAGTLPSCVLRCFPVFRKKSPSRPVKSQLSRAAHRPRRRAEWTLGPGWGRAPWMRLPLPPLVWSEEPLVVGNRSQSSCPLEVAFLNENKNKSKTQNKKTPPEWRRNWFWRTVLEGSSDMHSGERKAENGAPRQGQGPSL